HQAEEEAIVQTPAKDDPDGERVEEEQATEEADVGDVSLRAAQDEQRQAQPVAEQAHGSEATDEDARARHTAQWTTRAHPRPAAARLRSVGSRTRSTPRTRPAPAKAKQKSGSVSSGQIQYHSPGTLKAPSAMFTCQRKPPIPARRVRMPKSSATPSAASITKVCRPKREKLGRTTCLRNAAYQPNAGLAISFWMKPSSHP